MAADELVPAPHDVLASDPERERVAVALREHGAAGRLDADELEERLAAAYAARRRGDLAALLVDLPASEPVPPAARERQALPGYATFVAISLFLIMIWALTGAGYFWPVWPIAGIALGTYKHWRRRGG